MGDSEGSRTESWLFEHFGVLWFTDGSVQLLSKVGVGTRGKSRFFV